MTLTPNIFERGRFSPEAVEGAKHKLTVLLVVYALGHLIAGIYYYWNAVYLGRPYPYNSYLNLPIARFTDYDNMILMCQNLDPYHDFSRSSYPPFANFLFYLFSTLSLRYGFFIYILAPVVFVRWAVNRITGNVPVLYRALAIIFLVIFSYPYLFTLDRGNAEFYILIGIGAFFTLYTSNKAIERDIACLGLAAGICIKVYPALLLLILLKDGRYFDLLKTLILCLLLTLASAAQFSGGAISALTDFTGMLGVTGQLVKDQFIYAHGNAGMFYAVVIVLKKCGWATALAYFNKVYWLLALLFMGAYCSLIAVARLSFWATSCCLVALMCLVPSLSNDYRTIQLLIPMLLYASANTPKNREYLAITLIFGALLVPRNYWLMFPEVDPGDIGIGSVLTPILLLALLNLILIAEYRRWGRTERTVATVAYS
jgi:hypothetical protein